MSVSTCTWKPATTIKFRRLSAQRHGNELLLGSDQRTFNVTQRHKNAVGRYRREEIKKQERKIRHRRGSDLGERWWFELGTGSMPHTLYQHSRLSTSFKFY